MPTLKTPGWKEGIGGAIAAMLVPMIVYRGRRHRQGGYSVVSAKSCSHFPSCLYVHQE